MPLKSLLCNRHIATLTSFLKNCMLLYLLNLSFLLLPYAHHILSYSLLLPPFSASLAPSPPFIYHHLLSFWLSYIYIHLQLSHSILPTSPLFLIPLSHPSILPQVLGTHPYPKCKCSWDIIGAQSSVEGHKNWVSSTMTTLAELWC